MIDNENSINSNYQNIFENNLSKTIKLFQPKLLKINKSSKFAEKIERNENEERLYKESVKSKYNKTGDINIYRAREEQKTEKMNKSSKDKRLEKF